ncbi:DsrE family protein [Pseudalkalibacillus hwajinpoensis]|uniref:Uncharacterized protein n=1 Tax=Guptibacillus hwajinpoensis TaxID=208199 RepID=A0A4U1MLQ6_9BACL|nr:DsrE family protein [Pseudalkalibacillus hwajinpoensis]TKD71847.1 hypothetical protein FBF83_03335 [Pseudalkalibacillus hwajinpoensis]
MAKVVIQVNETGDLYFRRITQNIINLKNKLGDKLVDCEVVVFGEGLGLLLSKDELVNQRIQSIIELDITFIACSNTLEKKSLSVQDLVCSVGSAGSGIAHLVMRQTEGWAYLSL